MPQFNYIAVEGANSTGKTNLARFLAERMDASLVLDNPESNPFLADFYTHPTRHAFSTQIFFLVSRYRQLKELAQPDLFVKRRVADYTFVRDQIFAKLNLTPREYGLYQSLVNMMQTEIPVPDLVVYLQVRSQSTLERIRQHKKAYAEAMTPGYLAGLVESFDHFFFHYTLTPLLIVNTSGLNLFESNQDLELVFQEIKKTSFGTRYFTPAQKDVLL
jgi:deoxyadenosine/deoxycytidine kinase